jgi:hypothetical protein
MNWNHTLLFLLFPLSIDWNTDVVRRPFPILTQRIHQTFLTPLTKQGKMFTTLSQQEDNTSCLSSSSSRSCKIERRSSVFCVLNRVEWGNQFQFVLVSPPSFVQHRENSDFAHRICRSRRGTDPPLTVPLVQYGEHCIINGLSAKIPQRTSSSGHILPFRSVIEVKRKTLPMEQKDRSLLMHQGENFLNQTAAQEYLRSMVRSDQK